MRAYLVASLAVLAASPTSRAFAERPRPTVIDVGKLVRRDSEAPVPPSSRLVYMHRCPPAGCMVTRGANDDSRLNISQIAQGATTIGPFTQSDDVWKALLQCVRDTYAPFNIGITDVDPGMLTPHYEHIVGGKPSQLRDDIPNAGGVAPATCTEIPNAMTFTFDVYGPDPLTLCWTASQEIAHAFGLEHELHSSDPMTYLAGPLPKRFQAATVQCGEGTPRTCACTPGGLQNTYEHILAMFGPGLPTPPMIAVKAPTSGKTVQPGFVLRVNAMDDVAVDRVEMIFGGNVIATATEPPFTIKAPDVIDPGPHTLEIRAVDVQGTPASTMLDIVMGPPCTASKGCEGQDVCVMGVCLPGPEAAGGLGYDCQSHTECLSRNCIKESGEAIGHCVESCDPAQKGSCPNEFECLAIGAEGGGVCWPSSGGGCCDAGGSGTGAIVLSAGVMLLVLRRRRGR